MIEQLIGHITHQQIDDICQVFKQQYRDYVHMVNSDEHMALHAPEYADHRGQHDLSHAIVSGFRDGANVSGFRIKCMRDKGGHTRPELNSPTLTVHIQSHGTNLKSKYLKTYYQMNADNFGRDVLYCFFVYIERNNRLLQVSLCLPNSRGNIIREEIVLSTQQLIRIAS